MPLLPGDRIQIDEFEFLVSYERMTSAVPEPLMRPSRKRQRVDQPERLPAPHSTASRLTQKEEESVALSR
ncbi:hypothetical protein GC176_13210 [bacterium]|nr:hypothetical protein [bacterium]